MTIVFATNCGSFAMLAADRLQSIYHGPENGYERFAEVCKIAVHKTLSVAAATSGIGRILDNRDTTDIVQEVLDELVRPEQVTGLTARLKHRLLSAAKKERAARIRDFGSAVPGDAIMVYVAFITLAGSCAVDFVQFPETEIGRSAAETRRRMGRADGLNSAPLVVRTLYEDPSEYVDRTALYGWKKEPDGQANHLRTVIQAGIDHEAACRPDGQNVECGGGIDIVIVDKDGARFWPVSTQ